MTVRSSGRARYLLVLLILLLAGAWSGQMVSHQLWYDQNTDVLVDCVLEAVQVVPDDASDAEVDQAVRACLRQKQMKRFAAMLGGSVLVAGLGFLLMFLLPRRSVRRAAPLRDVPDEWLERAESLGASLKDVRIVFGAVHLRVPFTVRHRGKVCVVLPRGVTSLPPAQANALLRHELAHVAAGDVTLVWLSTGLWVALVPVLALPVVIAAFQGRFVPVTFIGDLNLSWFDYALRSAVLLVMAGLVSLAILRTREHEADLAGGDAERADMAALLSNHPPSRRPAWWRAPLAIHPSPRRRKEAVSEPRLATRTPWTDLAVVVFATTLTTAASGTVGYQLGFMRSAVYQFGVVSVVQGIAIALTWALPMWRRTVGNPRPPVLLPLAGLAAGVSLGLLISEVNQDAALRVTAPLAAVGAGVLSLAVARLSGNQVLVGVFNVLLFAGAYWFGLNMSVADAGASWVDRYWDAALVPDVLVPQAIWFLAVALFGVWWMARAHIAPMVVTAVAAGAGMLIRYHTGPVVEGSAYSAVVAAAVAALACFTALLIVGRPGAALVSTLVSTAVVAVGIAPGQLKLIGVAFSVLAPALLTVTPPLALLPGWNRERPPALLWAAPLLAVLIALGISEVLPQPAFLAAPR